MQVFVPRCPSCKKKHTLVLTETKDREIVLGGLATAPFRVRCVQSAGGCGMYYYLDDLSRLYVAEERAS